MLVPLGNLFLEHLDLFLILHGITQYVNNLITRRDVKMMVTAVVDDMADNLIHAHLPMLMTVPPCFRKTRVGQMWNQVRHSVQTDRYKLVDWPSGKWIEAEPEPCVGRLVGRKF